MLIKWISVLQSYNFYLKAEATRTKYVEHSLREKEARSSIKLLRKGGEENYLNVELYGPGIAD
ncbi:hypothetical protein NQ318_000923 [Aromia moschata]|uniref:Uncharacterized protein n=1 Tax=Aromia moschata TaxID=1265417 RepID=A0AAV8ZDR9_9CUCU|nr:hypothetical protein NQ318_000923 [Aromia moschata]